jgi:hypothetical protein
MPAVAGWYHCSVKPVQRSVGRSAVAAAAYRLGECLEDHRLGETYDYTRRSGVVTAFTVAPDHAPDWVYDPETLWNRAEAAETRINSQVAREYEIALPSAVSADDREGIARSFAQGLVNRYGVAVTVAIHEPSRYGDDRNFHAHILTTTRAIEEDGFGKKTRVLDDRKTGPQEVLFVRQYAAALINDALERAGVDERVDHRSFEARGIDREPTEHLGPGAAEIEREGKQSERGDRNREIEEANRKADQLVEELAALDAEIAEEQQRLLNERFGPPEEIQPDTPAPDPAGATDGGDRQDRVLSDEAKREARSAFEPDVAVPDSEPDHALSDEEKLHARDPIEDADAVDRQIGTGEIRHEGLGMPWWQRVAVFMTRIGEHVVEHVIEPAVEAAQDAWQRFVDWRRGDIDRDDGPDFNR